MKKYAAFAAALMLSAFFAAPSYAQVVYTTKDKGGTIASGGTAQTAIAFNQYRRIWCIQNDPAATETLYVRVNGTASATSGIGLSAGQQACSTYGLVDPSAVSVYAATTAHVFFGFEGQ